MTERFTGSLADFGAADLASAGGKGANLGELVRNGFPVPAGFIVTTAAYSALLAESGLGAELEKLLEVENAGARIRELIIEGPIPARVIEDIAAAYAALGGGALAVRSSATAEDLPGAAFAGQQDTFLNVVGEQAVARAVVECWASLWTDRAILYRQRQGTDPHQVSMAVVVQEMVPVDIAGVMFTANPLTGDRREILIDASAGLGEAVVSGRVTPEYYVLDKTGRTQAFTPGSQEVGVRAAAGGGTQESAGTGSTRPGLSDERLAELARLGLRAQEHFGQPQDVEWAIAGARVYLLQARPMTALPPQPARLNPFQRMTGPIFVEMFQQRPYPLDVSGWMQRGILAMLSRMAGSVGVVFPSVVELLPEEDGVVLRLVPPVPHPTWRTLAAPVSLARRARQYDPARWTHDSRFTTYLKNVHRLTAQDPRPSPGRAS
jgi:rifampicin phosphotransferase